MILLLSLISLSTFFASDVSSQKEFSDERVSRSLTIDSFLSMSKIPPKIIDSGFKIL
jgi:hypothetical protein